MASAPSIRVPVFRERVAGKSAKPVWLRLSALTIILLLTPAIRAQNWRLIWSDEFNGPAGTIPSTTDWNFVHGWGPKGNHEIQWYCEPADNNGPCEPKDPNLYLDGNGNL